MNDGRPVRRKTLMEAQKTDAKPGIELGPDIKAKIAQQLRGMYGKVLDQGVPDRFIEILKRLDHPKATEFEE